MALAYAAVKVLSQPSRCSVLSDFGVSQKQNFTVQMIVRILFECSVRKIPTLNAGLNRIIVISKNFLLESSAEVMHPTQAQQN